MHGKCNALEELCLQNLLLIMDNKIKEEKLYLRISALEETNTMLLKELERMAQRQQKTEERIELSQEYNDKITYRHNEMVATINTIISELNNVISTLSNKTDENYYVLRVLCKKEFNQGIFRTGNF